MVGLRRVGPGEVGRYFLPFPVDGDDAHQCKPACYRIYETHISLLCEYGHSAGAWTRMRDGSFGGSWFEAKMGDLPVFAPFVDTEEV